jgi:hypothetical protein
MKAVGAPTPSLPTEGQQRQRLDVQRLLGDDLFLKKSTPRPQAVFMVKVTHTSGTSLIFLCGAVTENRECVSVGSERTQAKWLADHDAVQTSEAQKSSGY